MAGTQPYGGLSWGGLSACLPVPLPPGPSTLFPIYNGLPLDSPLVFTAPPIQAGQVIKGNQFILLFGNVTGITQALLIGVPQGNLTTLLAHGAWFKFPVTVQTQVLGSLLLATFTVSINTPLTL